MESIAFSGRLSSCPCMRASIVLLSVNTCSMLCDISVRGVGILMKLSIYSHLVLAWFYCSCLTKLLAENKEGGCDRWQMWLSRKCSSLCGAVVINNNNIIISVISVEICRHHHHNHHHISSVPITLRPRLHYRVNVAALNSESCCD